MKTHRILLSALFITLLSSCYVTPAPYGRSPYSPYSTGGRLVTPREMHPRSPYSPGGSIVLPREARRVNHRGGVYYTHRGVWYCPFGRGYTVCPRPY